MARRMKGSQMMELLKPRAPSQKICRAVDDEMKREADRTCRGTNQAGKAEWLAMIIRKSMFQNQQRKKVKVMSTDCVTTRT
jgi:hypothetical protein